MRELWHFNSLRPLELAGRHLGRDSQPLWESTGGFPDVVSRTRSRIPRQTSSGLQVTFGSRMLRGRESARLMSLEHGGDLALARAHFPDCVEPLIDLSTGINPNPYALPPLPLAVFARLPEPDALERLALAAAAAYGAPSIHTVTP